MIVISNILLQLYIESVISPAKRVTHIRVVIIIDVFKDVCIILIKAVDFLLKGCPKQPSHLALGSQTLPKKLLRFHVLFVKLLPHNVRQILIQLEMLIVILEGVDIVSNSDQGAGGAG
jgi:hypothetical protein